MDTQPVAQGRPVLVTLPAEIGIANARGVHQRLAAASASGVHAVIADMTVTTFCAAAGVRPRMRQHQRDANGTELGC